MRKIYHLEDKKSGSHRYYGSLLALCRDNPDIGVSRHTLYRYDFETPYENEKVIIRKDHMQTTVDVTNKKF